MQRREASAFRGKRRNDGDVLAGNHAAARVAVSVDHVAPDDGGRAGRDQVNRAEVAGQEVVFAVDGERERVARLNAVHIGNAPVDVDAHVRPVRQRGTVGNVNPGVPRFLLQLDAVDDHLVRDVGSARLGRVRIVGVGRSGICRQTYRQYASHRHADGGEEQEKPLRTQASGACESGQSKGHENLLGNLETLQWKGLFAGFHFTEPQPSPSSTNTSGFAFVTPPTQARQARRAFEPNNPAPMQGHAGARPTYPFRALRTIKSQSTG